MAYNRIIESSIGPPGETGYLIKDLRQNFTIEKSDKESTNKLNLSIYNLNENTIDTIAKAKNKVILRAGYLDEGISSLFFGDIVSTINKKEGPNKILEIEAFDGQTNIQNNNISISYTSGTIKQQVFNDLVAAFGIPLTNPQNLSGQFANGYSYVGKVKDALTEILSPFNKSWTIQNEQLIIITKGESVQRTGLLISPSTGLIESPEAISDQDEKQSNIDEVPKRWKIKSLLFPQLFPGVEVQIQSNKVNGIFRVESVYMTGDNYEGDFMCETEVIAI